MKPTNGVDVVPLIGGILGIFSSTDSEITRQMRAINDNNCRVVQMVPAKRDFISILVSFLLLVLTLGIYTRYPAYFIVWEKCD